MAISDELERIAGELDTLKDEIESQKEDVETLEEESERLQSELDDANRTINMLAERVFGPSPCGQPLPKEPRTWGGIEELVQSLPTKDVEVTIKKLRKELER